MSALGKTEPATQANFDEARYVGANPDVAAFVQAGGDARRHFLDHGLGEKRRQLTRPAHDAKLAEYRSRYKRFGKVLDAAVGAGGKFTFARDRNAFPILYGSSTYDIAAYDRESANAGFGPFVDEVRDNPAKLYADIGCGRRNAKFDNCLYVEVYPSVSADLIMTPASSYPIATGSLDGIGCFAVLEHVAEPWKVAEEFRRMLKKGGKVFIDWPFLQPVHGYPSHYYNATRAGLERLFTDGYDIEVIDTFPNQTPPHSVRWYLSVMLEELGRTDPATQNRLMSTPVSHLVAEDPNGPFWSAINDKLSPDTVMTLACGNSLIARKR